MKLYPMKFFIPMKYKEMKWLTLTNFFWHVTHNRFICRFCVLDNEMRVTQCISQSIILPEESDTISAEPLAIVCPPRA